MLQQYARDFNCLSDQDRKTRQRALQKLSALASSPQSELDEAWEFEHPDRPASYDTTIAANASSAVKSRKEAAHEDKKVQYNIFDAYEHVFKDCIEEAYDAVWLAALRDDILGFSHLTVAKNA